MLLKGPTGCGKTRFMEYMAWRLKRPLITVSCHDDLTAADLVGRYLITSNETVWVDGPLARAVRCGGICYLDEVVEARKDTTVVIHPLADDRRILPMEKRGELLQAPPGIRAGDVVQPRLPERAEGTQAEHAPALRRHRIQLPRRPRSKRRSSSPKPALDAASADKLMRLAQMTRNLKGNGLDEGASTRLLVHAAKLIARGIAPRTACSGAIAEALTDDPEMLRAINELASSLF